MQQALTRGTVEGFFKHTILVAKQFGAGAQRIGHTQWKEFAAFDAVHAKALQRPLRIEIAKAVAVGKFDCAIDCEGSFSDAMHAAHRRSYGLWRTHRDHSGAATAEEIIGESAIERFLNLGSEADLRRAERRTTELVGTALNDGVDLLTIVRRDVAHIVDIFQTSFDFETADACIEHVFDALGSVHIAHGQLVSGGKYFAVGIDQVEIQSTELGAATAVGRSAKTMLRNIATSAVAHAQCAVHKALDGNGHGGGDGAQLTQGEFARNDDLRIAGPLQELGFFRRAGVHLRGGMKRNWGEVHFEQSQILCDEGIDTGFVKLTDQIFGFAQFIVVENGVERDVDAGAIQMGKITNVAYVFD